MQSPQSSSRPASSNSVTSCSKRSGQVAPIEPVGKTAVVAIPNAPRRASRASTELRSVATPPSRDVVDRGLPVHGHCDWSAQERNRFGEAHQRGTTNIRNLQTKRIPRTIPVAVPLGPRAEQEQRRSHHRGALSLVLNAAESGSGRSSGEDLGLSSRSVLAEAFAGRLVPQDSDDEPATALLAHIADWAPSAPDQKEEVRMTTDPKALVQKIVGLLRRAPRRRSLLRRLSRATHLPALL